MKFDITVVPSDPSKNAVWRAQALRLCRMNNQLGVDSRKQVWELCRQDFWYWSKGWAFIHETRLLDDDADLLSLETKVPFLPWPHQIPVVDRILKVLGKRDLRIVKSRGQGASWLLVLIFIWMWLFYRGFKGNLVSKDQDAVDKKNDMDSLMAKMDWLLEKLPEWMIGRKGREWNRNYNNHTLNRLDGETAITGYACTQDVASGGRCLVFGVDEHGKHPRPQDRDAMSSTQPISRCRLFISTPRGQDGEFFKIVHDDTIEEPVLYLDWRENPTQNRGLYRIEKGMPVEVDTEKYGPIPKEYRNSEKWIKLRNRLDERGYDLTSERERSPWYDEECLRVGAGPILIAQEYDMHFGASQARYFADALCNRLLQTARLPQRQGEFFVDPETLTGRWSENPDGRFKLWTELDLGRHPPLGEYIVACDVSAGLGGSGTSNSAITVLNRKTGRKVLAFVSPSTKPYVLAEVAIGLCKFFTGSRGEPAFLIWEHQGPGKEFGDRVERSGFQFYYRRKASRDAPLHSRQTDRPGYWMWKRSALLGPYREALLEGNFDNPDGPSIEELRQYQMGQDGEPYHLASKDKTDPGGAGAAHGDRVIADALAWQASREFGDQYESRRNQNKPDVMNPKGANPNSFAWRRQQYLELLRKQKRRSNW